MTEKVKVTQEQAEAVEMLIDYQRGQIERFKANTEKFESWVRPLAKLSVDDIEDALYKGYEVEPEFRVGDWIVVEDCACERIIGKVQMITDIEKLRTFTRIHYEDWWSVKSETTLRHATPEEIKAEKERRLWTEIGRPAGSFVIGDIGIAVDDTYTYNPNFIEALYYSRELKGFYPKESFISFEDGDSND